MNDRHNAWAQESPVSGSQMQPGSEAVSPAKNHDDGKTRSPPTGLTPSY
jgi:hypothetical protein